MAALQDKPLNELLSRSMVDIYVGPEETHWILHEKLLCARSPFFAKIFYSDNDSSPEAASRTQTFSLPDEEGDAFQLFVGWLYSGTAPRAAEESDLTVLFDLYLMAEKWQVGKLAADALTGVRAYYKASGTYPGLRRVQYIYANTEADSPMRRFLVGCVARMLALAEGIPAHWDKALKKNGQLAVDVILAIQKFGVHKENVPDFREEEEGSEAGSERRQQAEKQKEVLANGEGESEAAGEVESEEQGKEGEQHEE